MGKLFDRDLPPGNRFDDLLAAMRSRSADEGLQAIAVNWMADHRVTPERQLKWEAELPPGSATLTQTQFNGTVVGYYEDKIRDCQTPHFLDPSNTVNVIYGGDKPSEIVGDTLLVNLLDLTGLHPVLRTRKELGNSYLNDTNYPGSVSIDHEDVERWHRARLEDAETSAAETHIEQILKALSDHIDAGNPYQPTWATDWDEFLAQLSVGDPPNRWKELCGIGNRAVSGRWVIALTYKVREAGTVLRPTVVDAGWYQYHFPSPRESPPSRGGHPIDLVNDDPSKLLPEYIHAQIPFKLWHWKKSGRMTAKTISRGKRLLSILRWRHHGLLAGNPPDGSVIEWMPDPMHYD